MRLDKFLKVSRIIKRRTVAKEACDKGIVTINGKVAKSSSEVNIGDLLEIQFGDKGTCIKKWCKRNVWDNRIKLTIPQYIYISIK